jgi:transposase-like protein
MAVFTTGGFMKKYRFTESQIVEILKEAEGCIAITEVLRSHGISAATFYKWRSKYGGVLKRLSSNGSKSSSSSSPTTKPWSLS